MRALSVCLLVLAIASNAGAENRDSRWADWQTILYQARTPAQLAALRRIGLTGGMVFANRADPARADPAAIATLTGQRLPYYVENIATDYYAAYHRWRPDRPETADFTEAKRRHQEAPDDLAPFIRQPSLSDSAAFRPIHDRLVQTVRAHAPSRPLYYSLADEAGVADLAAAWDFDFAPASLAGFRTWLATQYRFLDALNEEWSTAFTTWDAVMPATTDQAMRRIGDNFAPWADFKAWMDVAFTQAVQAGTDAIHEAGPDALSAIEGAQIPGWGGYDYARLATAVDVMELYDFGENVAIARSFNPALTLLATVSVQDPAAIHTVWRAALRGARGTILWDEGDTLVTADGALSEDGRRLEPTLRALHDGIGALLINSRPDPAPIAILASQASFRTEWMLDHRAAGADWASRDAEAEYQDTAMRAATRGFSHLLAHLGLGARFVSPQMIAGGTLARDGIRALILPHTVALSSAEADAIGRFAASGGLVIADVTPGAFDEHSRRRAEPAPLLRAGVALFPLGDGPTPDAADGRDPAALARLAGLLAQAGVMPDFRLSNADGHFTRDVTISRHRIANGELYALHRDQLAQPAGRSTSGMVSLDLPRPRFAYAVGPGRALGRATHFDLRLDPASPTLVTLSDTPITAPELTGPAQARLGEPITLGVHGAAGTVMHIVATDPMGVADERYAGNLALASSHAPWPMPLTLEDAPGAWTVTATDVASGLHTTIRLTVTAPGALAQDR